MATPCGIALRNLRGNRARITSDEQVEVVLDRDYLDHGRVDRAHAVTIHKAQGVTCDSVLVVGPAGLYRNGARGLWSISIVFGSRRAVGATAEAA